MSLILLNEIFPNVVLDVMYIYVIVSFISRYQDILQGDFFEDYFLLAYKSLTWLLWTKTKCSKVCKVDRKTPDPPSFYNGPIPDTLDCQDGRRHDQQHLEARSSSGGVKRSKVARL